MDSDEEEPPPPPPPVSPPPDLGLYFGDEDPGEEKDLEQPSVSEASLFLDDSPSTSAADLPAPPTPQGNPPQLFEDEPPAPPIPADSPPPVAPFSPPPDLSPEEEQPDLPPTTTLAAKSSPSPWSENTLLSSGFTSHQTHSLDLDELEDINSQTSDLTPTTEAPSDDNQFSKVGIERMPSSSEEEASSNSIPAHTPPLPGSRFDDTTDALQELTTSDEEETRPTTRPGPTVIDVMVLQHDEELDEADLPPLPSSLPPDLPSSPPPDLPGSSPPPDFPPSLPPEESDLSLFTEEEGNTPQADSSEEEDKPPIMSPLKS